MARKSRFPQADLIFEIKDDRISLQSRKSSPRSHRRTGPHGGLLAKFDINSYARRGAAARLEELNQELAAIYAAFPDLRSGRGARGARKQATAAAPAAAVPGPARRRRRKAMSAAQRREVSARMKRYWAERRKSKKEA
jgi:hypothetical protein